MKMEKQRRHFLIVALALITLVSSSSVPAQVRQPDSTPDIAFVVSMPKPHTHMLHVEMRITQRATAPVVNEQILMMPVWTPGSYLVREFARHVQDFAATDSSGQALNWEKINKNSWRIATNGTRDWRASYRVYANELSVRTNELNSEHAFWSNAALLMYPEGLLNAPSTLQVLAPQPWKVATGLPPVPGHK